VVTDRVEQGIGKRLEFAFVRVIRCGSHKMSGFRHNIQVARSMLTDLLCQHGDNI
jgi:hypothetical protein